MLPSVLTFTHSNTILGYFQAFYPIKSLTSVHSECTETITKVTTKSVPSIFRWLKAVFIFSNPPPHRKRPNLSHWRSVISLRERAESAHPSESENRAALSHWGLRVEKRMLVASSHTHSGRYIINTIFFAVRLFFSAVATRHGYLFVSGTGYGPCSMLNAFYPRALSSGCVFFISRCARRAGHCCSVCTLSGPQVKFTEENREECDHGE
jgi:hypothetical protein